MVFSKLSEQKTRKYPSSKDGIIPFNTIFRFYRQVKMIKCIYCDNVQFKNGTGSVEHVILSSLGGKKSSRNICCQTCNNRLGSEIDKVLSDEFSYFSNMLNIITGRNKTAPVLKKAIEHNGLEYDILPGGEFKLSRSSITDNVINENEISLLITAESEEKALLLLEGKLKSLGMDIDSIPAFEAKSIREFLPKQHQRMCLGGQAQFRSASKMILTYLATLISPERLRNSQFNDVISYINGNNEAFTDVFLGSKLDLSVVPSVSGINHRVVIFASQKDQFVIGTLELFGNIRYSVKLSSAWNGPDIKKVYAIDPTTKINFEKDCHPLFLNEESPRQDIKKIITNGIEKIITEFKNRQMNAQLHNVITQAFTKHIGDNNTHLSDEILHKLIYDISLESAKLICRADSEENITLKKSNK